MVGLPEMVWWRRSFSQPACRPWAQPQTPSYSYTQDETWAGAFEAQRQEPEPEPEARQRQRRETTKLGCHHYARGQCRSARRCCPAPPQAREKKRKNERHFCHSWGGDVQRIPTIFGIVFSGQSLQLSPPLACVCVLSPDFSRSEPSGTGSKHCATDAAPLCWFGAWRLETRF